VRIVEVSLFKKDHSQTQKGPLTSKGASTVPAGTVTSADKRCLPFQVVWSRQRVELSHFSTAALSELFDTESESDPA
jgi:hypothetical protein